MNRNLRPRAVGFALTASLWVSSNAATLDFTRVGAPVFPELRRDVFTAAWGDYDRDGRPDIFFSGLDEGPTELWHNTAGGFVPVRPPGMAGDLARRGGAAWGDVDNDGFPDLLIAGAYQHPDVLYRNLGGTDFARIAITGASSGYGIGAIWSDFDRDGRLDGYIVNGGGSAAEPDYALRNAGNGNLVRITTGDLATWAEYSHGAAFGDFDGDGDDDLLVTAAWDQPNGFFRNNGDASFTRTNNGEIGTPQGGGGSTVAWVDFDNDGDLDLLFVSSQSGNVLYRNDAGTLTRVDGALPGNTPERVGAAWADFDNDGWLDLIVVKRSGLPVLYHGLGAGRFELIQTGTLPTYPAGANGVAVADYDGDGRLDVLLSNWQGQGSPALFHNESAGGHFLRLRLEGTFSNRSGIGTKIRVRTVVNGEDRWQLRVVGGFDSMGSQDLVAHFGLGPATEAAEIRLEWPSGKVQSLARTSANQTLDIAELVTAPLAILPEGGTFTNSVLVSLFSTISVAEIRYTADGSDPVATSTLYRTPLTVSGATTLKARLYVNGFPVSEIRTAVFAPLPPLRLDPVPGRFTNVLEFSLTSTVPNTLIRYTLDGSAPTADSPLFSKPVRITTSATVQARAFLNGFPVTDIVSGTYRRVYAFENEGIDAAWRGKFFGADYATDPRAAADADPDQDGSNNRQEFTVGTNPIDPLSGFTVGVRAVPEIRFASVPGTTYRILRLKAVPGGDATVVAEFMAKESKTVWVDTDAGVVVNPAFYIVQPVP